MAKKKAVPAATPPTIYEARLRLDGGVQKVRQISLSDAVANRQRGHDVVVCGGDLAANRSLAESIEQQANGRWKRCPPHASAGPKPCRTISRRCAVRQDTLFMKHLIATPSNNQMKFFTPELYVQFNSSDPAVADRANDAWENALNAYRIHLRRIEKDLPPGSRELSKTYLHDAELLDPRKPIALSSEVGLIAATQRTAGKVWQTHLVIYSLTGKVHTSQVREWPFSRKQAHWLYDELDAGSAKGVGIHRILLSNGTVVAVPFRGVVLRRMTVHAASLEEVALQTA
jgi:hypothetical protein